MRKFPLDSWGLRLGSKRSLAASLYARNGGATANEVIEACGEDQFQLLRELKLKGFKVATKREPNPHGRMVTRYFLSVDIKVLRRVLKAKRRPVNAL